MPPKKTWNFFFKWTNEKSTRANSYHTEPVSFDSHAGWFAKRVHADNCYLYVFSDEAGHPVGQVRIEKDPTATEAVISISVGEDQRGHGYATEMIARAAADFLHQHGNYTILAYVFKSNEISFRSFNKAGFTLLREEMVKDIPSYILCKK